MSNVQLSLFGNGLYVPLHGLFAVQFDLVGVWFHSQFRVPEWVRGHVVEGEMEPVVELRVFVLFPSYNDF